MHEWYTRKGTNIKSLIDQFIGYEHAVDEGYSEVTNVKVTNNVFRTEEEARDYVTRISYGGETAYIAAFTTERLTKAYQNAFNTFLERYREYKDFQKNLTIEYGRKSSKVTCPNCESSINLKYGGRYKMCPVCGSKKIISDSNWKVLETKKRMMERASDNLSTEAAKNGVTFMCGIEWHC